MNEELRYHVERQTAENVARGMTPEEARRQAVLQFGGVEGVKETCREGRRGSWMEAFWQDVRFGLRMLRKSPGFTAIAVLTLALGIGASTAIFSIADAVLFRPLPYAHSDRLVSIQGAEEGPRAIVGGVSYLNFLDWQKQARSFEEMAAYIVSGSTLTGSGEATRLPSADVAPELFSLLSARPLLGRTLTPEDNEKGAPSVVVIGESLWRSRFHGNRKVLGSVLTLDKEPFTVVGVMPQDFHFPVFNPEPELWKPVRHDEVLAPFLEARDVPFLHVVGRLRPGVGLSQAAAEMSIMEARLAREYPKDDQNQRANVVPLAQEIAGTAGPGILILLGAVSLLLLIACVNVANLLLSRGAGREREIAIRAALGADRARIFRQFLTESVLLGVAGGATGLLVAYAGLLALASTMTKNLPPVRPIEINAQVLGFALCISVLTGIVFGLMPALQSMRTGFHLRGQLKGGRLRSTAGRAESRMQDALVVWEVGLALVLVTGAGLLIRSLVRLQNVAPGFGAEHLLTATVSLPLSQYAKPEEWAQFNKELTGKIQALPGVTGAAYGDYVPFTAAPQSQQFAIEGRPATGGQQTTAADFALVSPLYFGVMQIPLMRGRTFTAFDAVLPVGTHKPEDLAPTVAIVNTAFVRLFFSNEDPLGKKLLLGGAHEIVGVVGNTKQWSLSAAAPPMIYIPYLQDPVWVTTLVVRTRGNPAGLETAIRHEVSSLDPDLPIGEMQSITGLIGRSTADSRFRTLLLGLFSTLALILTTVGIYGVLAYAVIQRTREIGIRMALGAQPGGVLRMILGRGLRLIILGIASGLAISFWATRLVSKFLFEVSATDPLTFLGVAALFIFVGLVACYVPARRAMRVDPMVALRHE